MTARLTPATARAGMLLDLAARCETASGPDREIDAAIMRLFTNSVESDDGDWWYGPHDEMPRTVPHFTASIDAALTLVPEGWECALYWGVPGFNPNAQLERENTRRVLIDGTSVTLALALCAAALRARAAVTP